MIARPLGQPKGKPSLSAWISGRARWLRKHYFVPATLAPALIILFAYTYFPALYSIVLSLFRTRLLTPVEFVGLANYRSVLADPLFWKALRNTTIYSVVTIAGTIGVGMALALMLDTKVYGRDLFRVIFFMPFIIPYAAHALLWTWLYDPRFGLVNYLLGLVSIGPVAWLKSSTWVLPSFILMNIWKRTGFAMVLFLAGLTTIPRELYDAATVDGASGLDKFVRVTLPLLRPVMLFVIVLSFLATFQIFVEPFIMTKAGPSNSSLSMVYLIYQVGLGTMNIGMASTMAVILFVLIFVISLLLIRALDIEQIY